MYTVLIHHPLSYSSTTAPRHCLHNSWDPFSLTTCMKGISLPSVWPCLPLLPTAATSVSSLRLYELPIRLRLVATCKREAYGRDTRDSGTRSLVRSVNRSRNQRLHTLLYCGVSITVKTATQVVAIHLQLEYLQPRQH